MGQLHAPGRHDIGDLFGLVGFRQSTSELSVLSMTSCIQPRNAWDQAFDLSFRYQDWQASPSAVTEGVNACVNDAQCLHWPHLLPGWGPRRQSRIC